jgi:hypothetical protein
MGRVGLLKFLHLARPHTFMCSCHLGKQEKTILLDKTDQNSLWLISDTLHAIHNPNEAEVAGRCAKKPQTLTHRPVPFNATIIEAIQRK